MNFKNKKSVFYEVSTKKDILYNNTEIREMQSYVHIRQKITSDYSIMNEINRRKKMMEMFFLEQHYPVE